MYKGLRWCARKQVPFYVVLSLSPRGRQRAPVTLVTYLGLMTPRLGVLLSRFCGLLLCSVVTQIKGRQEIASYHKERAVNFACEASLTGRMLSVWTAG